MNRRLERYAFPDDRDYPLSKPGRTREKRLWRTGPVLDQQDLPACVGFMATHWLMAHPISQYLDPVGIYTAAQYVDEWEGTCVDYDTEALTHRGWLRGDEIQDGDLIMGIDTETEHLRFAVVDRVHRHQGMRYRIWENGQFNAAVTDNHKWVVKNRLTEQSLSLVETRRLKSQHAALRSAPSGFCCPDFPTVDDDIVAAVAWACTEGHYRPEYRRGNGVVISQKSHKSHVASIMENLGVARGYEKSDGCHTWELSGSVAEAVRSAAPSKAPSMEWLSTLTKRQLRIFIDNCVLGDGSFIDGSASGRLDRRVFHQKPGATLDSFIAACVMAGIPISRASSVSENSVTETWSLRKSSDVEIRSLTASDYTTGAVWCPQSKLGTFVARRNGCVFITGNSYDGTSVRAAMKVLRNFRFFNEFHATNDVETLATFVLEEGPLGLGTNWYDRMFEPNDYGFILPRGRIAGGHAYLVIGADFPREKLTILNSWGPNWGDQGKAFIDFQDMQQLLDEDGEAWAGIEARAA